MNQLKAEFASLKKDDEKKIEKLRGECGDWKGRWSKNHKILIGMQKVVDNLEQRCTEQKKKISKDKEQIESQTRQIKMLDAQLAANKRARTKVLESQVKSLLDDTSRLKATVAEVSASRDQLQADLGDVKRKHLETQVSHAAQHDEEINGLKQKYESKLLAQKNQS